MEQREKVLAEIAKKIATEAANVAKYEGEAAKAGDAVLKASSESSRKSRQRTHENALDKVAVARKKLSELEGQKATKGRELNRAKESLAKAEADQRKVDGRADERRRRDEQQHSQELTREERERATLRRVPQVVRHEVVLPDTITVLFLSSNPKDRDDPDAIPVLDIDDEVRLVDQRIRAAKYRDSVVLKSRWAARPSDLIQALNEVEPTVVHVSGHGTEEGDLVLRDDAGGPKYIPIEAMAATLATVADHVRVVVLNTCYSHGQAEAAVASVDIAIGMGTTIGDEAARVFSAAFYSGISFGHSVKKAFDQAVAQLMLEGIPEHDTPELFSKDGVDPSQVILVEPADGSTSSPVVVVPAPMLPLPTQRRPACAQVLDVVPADGGATVHVGNTGEEDAVNVNVQFLDGGGQVVHTPEFMEPLPLARLRPGSPVRLRAVPEGGDPVRYQVRLSWVDEQGGSHEADQSITAV